MVFESLASSEKDEYPLRSKDPRAILIKEWLLSRHISLWGEHFELVKDGPSRAVDWFIQELDAYSTFVRNKWEEEGIRHG